MATTNLTTLIQQIVAEAQRLSIAYTNQQHAPVNYACVFTQSADEYEDMVRIANQLGPVVQETAMGPVFHVVPIVTVAGELRLLKIRRPDPKRPERGYADFTVSDYETFKKTYLGKPGFGIIKRVEMEMIELVDPSYNAVAYYAHPTLATVLGINLHDR
ncbi:MAG: hypothetical protein A2666_02995 [Parcubacteria group bacterium RIFCSPHIGHO2_01_FULL_47_10b]|nr:MAG: hypothetical protein A2666_02995 [Parcubacteria group bacterium RIFCSPHIGHO2_01_FULL_47_10b]